MSDSRDSILKSVFVGTISGLTYFVSKAPDPFANYCYVFSMTGLGMFLVNNGRGIFRDTRKALGYDRK